MKKKEKELQFMGEVGSVYADNWLVEELNNVLNMPGYVKNLEEDPERFVDIYTEVLDQLSKIESK